MVIMVVSRPLVYAPTLPHSQYHYTNLTVVRASVRVSVRPSGKVTGSYLTRVNKLAFFASLSFDITEVVDRNSMPL